MDEIFLIPTIDLFLYSQFCIDVWRKVSTPITCEEIKKAINEAQFQTAYFKDIDYCDRAWHIERIAYLVVVKDPTPIHIDVGVPDFGSMGPIIEDGYHRLTAAFYRNDSHIPANVSGGFRYAQSLFPSVKFPR